MYLAGYSVELRSWTLMVVRNKFYCKLPSKSKNKILWNIAEYGNMMVKDYITLLHIIAVVNPSQTVPHSCPEVYQLHVVQV